MSANIIIIGGNAAGPSAAAKAKRVSPESNVIMFEQSEFISTGTCEIPYVLSGLIDSWEKLVFFEPGKFKEEKGVDVFIRHCVQSIDRRGKTIAVKDLNSGKFTEFKYDRLILATGSLSVVPQGFEMPFRNAFFMKGVSDIRNILNYIQINRISKICIIGAGYIGLETADALKTRGFEIEILDVSQYPMPKTEPEIQRILLEKLNELKIPFYGNSGAFTLITEKDEIKGLKSGGKFHEGELFLLCTGFRPNSELAINCGLETGKSTAIKVNKRLQTSDSNIYAAGDNIEITNAVTQRPDYIPLATIAHDAGHTAGDNAAGGNSIFKDIVKNIAVKISDLSLVSVGLTEKEGREFFGNIRSVKHILPNLVKVMPDSRNSFGKLVYLPDRRLIGATFIGGNEVIGYGDIISSFILNKLPANNLSQINFSYTPPLSPFINLLSYLGRKIN